MTRLLLSLGVVLTVTSTAGAQVAYPTFAPTSHAFAPTGAGPATRLAALDQNGDGLVDVVVAGPVSGGLGISTLLSSSSGLVSPGSSQLVPSVYSSPLTLPLGLPPVAFSDLDLDGVVDAAGPALLGTIEQVTELGPIVDWWLCPWSAPGATTGDFGAPVLFNAWHLGKSGPLLPTLYASVAGAVLGDIDGDSYPDLVFGAGAGLGAESAVFACLNDGQGRFSQGLTLGLPIFTRHPLLADLNNDGMLDIVGPRDQWPVLSSDSVQFAINDGTGWFPAISTTLVGTSVRDVVVADVDVDGSPDVLAVAGGGESSCAFVLSGDASGSLHPPVVLLAGVQGVSAVADVDANGMPDLVGFETTDALGLHADPDRIYVALARLPASFADPLAYPSTAFSQIVVKDVNGDGHPDLVAGGAAGVELFRRIPTVVPYGAGTAGCAGSERLVGVGEPRVGNADFALHCDKAPGIGEGLWMITDLPDVLGSDPFYIGLTLHVDFVSGNTLWMGYSASTIDGLGDIPLPIPADPGIAGLNAFVQALWVWPDKACPLGPMGISSTNGLAFQVLP